MKSKKVRVISRLFWSHPVRGAWIEILSDGDISLAGRTSHPVRGAWIEIDYEFW